MINYDYLNLDPLLDLLLKERVQPLVVLFADRPNQVLFNFEITRFNNSMVAQFVKVPLFLLSQIKEKFPSFEFKSDTSDLTYLFSQDWHFIDSSTLETMEESLNHFFPVTRNQKYRSVSKSVIGPCQTFDHIRPLYQFALCDFLDEIEDRITRRIPLKIRHWDDNIHLNIISGLVINTEFINKTEYLIIEGHQNIRLDRVYDMLPI